jgi:hypothetical protein
MAIDMSNQEKTTGGFAGFKGFIGFVGLEIAARCMVDKKNADASPFAVGPFPSNPARSC